MATSILLCTLSLIVHTIQTPQIFEDKGTCQISYQSRKITKEYKVPLLITAEDQDFQLLFSLCGHIPTVFPNDGSCSKTCLYNKNSHSLITGTQTIGIPFEWEDEPTNDINVILNDEMKCTSERNYKITIKMVALDSLLKRPRLTIENDCEIKVEMLKPDYEPPCTNLLSSKELINLRALKGQKISIPWEGKEFKIALCGTNRDCGLGSAGCLKDNNNTMILGTTSSQKVKFDRENNQLTVVASIKEGRRKLRNMEVILKCNWDVPFYSNAKFIKPSTQGRQYKFELESSFGCVKISSDCRIADKNNGFIYDLKGLTQSTGTKIKLNSINFILNICGDLKAIGPNGNNCTKQHSQICEIDKNVYINRGSIPSFEVTDEHSIRVVLKEGQKCNESMSYSTIIDIKCSFQDKGPVIIKNEDCVTTLLWKTPKGCPKFQSEADDCIVTTHLGGINISNLYRNDDRIHSFSASEKFKFNVCGKLHSSCLSQKDVSACYVSGGSEHIIGWNKPKLSYINGNFKLKYFGEKCKTANKMSSLTINLYCSYSQVPRESKLNKRDSCTFEADIHSIKACLSQDVVDCHLENLALKYDLTELLAKETNYKVQDENDKNVTYFLNVCRPLLNENGLIPGNSMIYLMDKSKPHILDRFTSLGKIARPELTDDGKLVINSILGRSCGLGTDYSSVIRFECSERNERPKLLERKNCRFEFLWRTKYACPAAKPGGSCSLKGEARVQIPSDEIRFERNGHSYKFSLCDVNYETCKNGSCMKNKLTRNIWMQNRKPHVEVNLASSSLECTGNNLKTVNITIQCDPNNQDMLISKIGQNTCHVDLLMKTSVICRIGKDINTRELDGVKNNEQKTPIAKLDILNMDPVSHISDVENISLNKVNMSTNNKKPEQLAEVKYENLIDNKEVEVKLDNKFIERKETKTDEKNLEYKTMSDTNLDHNRALSMDRFSYQKCDTVNVGTKTFDLKNIKSSTITGMNTYMINFNGTSSTCGGKICKNAKPILHFIEDCPNVLYSENHILLSYTIKGECLTEDNLTQSMRIDADFKIEIALKCNGSTQFIILYKEKDCFVGFEYCSPELCDLVEIVNHSSVVAISLGVSFLVVALSIFSYIFYRKNSKRCHYKSVNETETTFINHSKLL